MTARPQRKASDDGAWKFERVCDLIRQQIERLGPDSGNHTYQDARRGEWEALRSYIQGLESEATKPHFPKEDSK